MDDKTSGHVVTGKDTEHHDLVTSTSASYSGCSGFDFQFGHLLF
jgi:hypothetical protein